MTTQQEHNPTSEIPEPVPTTQINADAKQASSASEMQEEVTYDSIPSSPLFQIMK